MMRKTMKISDFEEKCMDCEGEGKLFTRDNKPERRNFSYPDGPEQLSNISALSPEEKATIVKCKACNGTGLIPSIKGKRILAFLKKYQNES